MNQKRIWEGRKEPEFSNLIFDFYLRNRIFLLSGAFIFSIGPFPSSFGKQLFSKATKSKLNVFCTKLSTIRRVFPSSSFRKQLLAIRFFLSSELPGRGEADRRYLGKNSSWAQIHVWKIHVWQIHLIALNYSMCLYFNTNISYKTLIRCVDESLIDRYRNIFGIFL